MSVEAYHLAAEGHFEKSKEEWERTRTLAYYSIAPNLKRGTTLTSFMPFIWDRKAVNKTLTDQEALEKFTRAKERFKNLA